MQNLVPESQALADELSAVRTALDRMQAVLELSADGTIVHANDNFLRLTGYRADEIVGMHHTLLCEPDAGASEADSHFWADLRRGKPARAECELLGRGGAVAWIDATFSPVVHADGQVDRVVVFGTDITERKRRGFEHAAMVAALLRSQALAEFDMNGSLLHASEQFLSLFGYGIGDVEGEHHRVFCTDEDVASAAYGRFWEKLGRGEPVEGCFKRIGNGGMEVWVQASYHPIPGLTGYPVKVLEFVTDITARMQAGAQPRAAGARRRVEAGMVPAPRMAQATPAVSAA